MNTQSLVREELDAPQTRAAFETAFRSVRLLIGGCVAISIATLVAIVLMRNHHAEVTSAVSIRGTIVVASALLMTLFARRAARGASRMYLRLGWSPRSWWWPSWRSSRSPAHSRCG